MFAYVIIVTFTFKLIILNGTGVLFVISAIKVTTLNSFWNIEA